MDIGIFEVMFVAFDISLIMAFLYYRFVRKLTFREIVVVNNLDENSWSWKFKTFFAPNRIGFLPFVIVGLY